MRSFRKGNLKLYKKFRQHRTFVNVLCRMILIVSVVAMVFANSLEVFALGGIITGSSTEGDTFWQNISSPRDLKISQMISIKDSNLSLDDNFSDEKKTFDFSIPFAIEGKFKPSISTSINNSHSSTGESAKWQDFPGNWHYYDYMHLYNKNTTTYYRIVTDDSSTDMGATLFNYYLSHYIVPTGKRRSENMMLTTEENYGRVLNPIVEGCAAANEWQTYVGEAIPLYQNGKIVKKVEMITISAIDYYFGTIMESDKSYRSKDLDGILYTTHTYRFNYTNEMEELTVPQVETESGYDIDKGISEDDLIILNNENTTDIAKSQYYLSDIKITDKSSIPWTNYTKPFSPNGKRYLYIRSNYVDGSKNYIESDAEICEIKYMKSSSAIVGSTPKKGEAVDVGDEITLIQNGAAPDASLFYVVDAKSAPILTRVSYENRQSYMLDDKAGGAKYVKDDGIVYIKINEIWYKSSDENLKVYTEPIVTDEQLRVTNTIGIHVLVGDDGKEIGDFQMVRFTNGTTQQTKAPQTNLETSSNSPTVVDFGDSIGLFCETEGSKIFYTTNGSAPVIKVTENGPVAGANTKEYNDMEPIVVDKSIASYGETFMIMAQAVTYTKIDDIFYRTHLDSPVAKFIYKLGEQQSVAGVKSIPQTNADTPTEVMIGSKIQLYSDTEGVDIYYTVDGSEPIFDPVTKEVGSNTYKYSGTTGVVVGKATDSSMFTITAVAYKEGFAVGDISRMIFSYPSSVSSPYASIPSGNVATNTEVILKTATEGAVIYYEIAQGDKVPKDPTTSSNVFDVTNPIKITKKTTVKAFAVKDGMESTVSSYTYTVSKKLATPIPSVNTGAVVASGTVISLTADKDATIYFTLDGSNPMDPTNTKIQVGNKVVLNGDAGSMIILRAYAVKGDSVSDVGTYSYSISSYTGGIYADRESGETVKNGDVISLHTDMTQATIYYTTDGSTPTESSHSGSTVTVDGEPGAQFTIMAMAVASGSTKATSFESFTYVIMDKLAAPTASVPDNAVFTEEGVVELIAEKGNIYYTTDGSVPSAASNLYKKAIVIEEPVTIMAIVIDEAYQESDVSTFTYGYAEQVAAPTASFTSGELEMGTEVTFATTTEGATIYYRTDGIEPNPDNKDGLEIYTGPIEMNKATSFKVIAVKEHMRDSQVLSVRYTVKEPIVQEVVQEESEQVNINDTGRLQSRHSFSDTQSGPSYTDIILRNATFGAVVSGEEGSIPVNIQLEVEKVQVTEATDRTIKNVISDDYGVVTSYDVKLICDKEEIQPDKEIEVGIPIPVEYQNSIIHLVRVQDDGYVEVCNTRRSNGVAYVKTEALGCYSIAAPIGYKQDEEGVPQKAIYYGGAVLFVGVGSLLLYLARKKKKEG